MHVSPISKSIPANHVCPVRVWSVDPEQPLCKGIVGQVLHLSRGGVLVVVTPVTMVTEAVGVLNTEVKVLCLKRL